MNSNAWSRPVLNLNLRAWRALRQRHRDPIGAALALRCYLTGGMMSALGTVQNRVYRRTLERLELRPPLFIVGHWRSGTTLLHELLALDDSFASPSTFACFNPDYSLLARHRTLSTTPLTRPPGDMNVSASSPQEEEFAMLCMGATSPYEAFIFPAAMYQLEALSDPDLFEPSQGRRWNEAMTWFLKVTAYLHGADKRPLIKSPANSFRVSRLDTLFPGARFIRIVREPYAVFASTLRLWRSMWDRYALTAPLGEEMLIERILQTRLALERKLKNSLQDLPPERFAAIRYEDLVADASGTIEHLYERLSLGDPSPILPKVTAYMARNPRPTAPSSEQWRALIQARWPDLFDEFSYSRG